MKYFKAATVEGYKFEYRDPAAFPAKLPPREAPALDQDAYTNSELGAISAAYYYFRAVNYFINTGDSGPMDYASTTTCQNCDQEKSIYQNFFSNGGYSGNSDIMISKMRIVKKGTTGYVIHGQLDYKPVEIFTPSKSTYMRTPDWSGNYEVTVIWTQSQRMAIEGYGLAKNG